MKKEWLLHLEISAVKVKNYNMGYGFISISHIFYILEESVMNKNYNEKVKYEIEDYIGTIKESKSHDWTKSVIRISWGDNAPTLDIRNVNIKDNRIGKGISLTNEEADRLVDLLVKNDYGSVSELKSAIKRKESIYQVDNKKKKRSVLVIGEHDGNIF